MASGASASVDLLEKLRVANMVVKIAPLSLRRALNFLRHSTVSCLWSVEATRSRWQIHGCFNASPAVILLAGLTVSIELIKFFASGVTVSHSGDGYCESKGQRLDRRFGTRMRPRAPPTLRMAGNTAITKRPTISPSKASFRKLLAIVTQLYLTTARPTLT